MEQTNVLDEQSSIICALLCDFLNGKTNEVFDKVYDHMSKKSSEFMKNFIPMIINQHCYITSYDIFKTDFNLTFTDIISSVRIDNEDDNYASFESLKNTITCSLPNTKEIYNYIKILESRYIYIPLIDSKYGQKTGHMSSVIFDKQKSNIYLFDPNGYISFFDEITMDDETYASMVEAGVEDYELLTRNEDKVNTLLYKYVEKFNEDNKTQYKYIPSSSWNPKRLCINSEFRNFSMQTGFCVPATVLFIHLLHITNDDVDNIFNLVGSINKSALFYLYVNYCCGVYGLLYSR